MKLAKKTLIFLCASSLLVIQPVFGERGEQGDAKNALVRGGDVRQLKGGKGGSSLKASKIKTDDQFDAAIEKVAEKCAALQLKIAELSLLQLKATIQVSALVNEVEKTAASVTNVNTIFPEVSTAANSYLTACRDLEDDVNAYKKAVSDASEIASKISSYEADLVELEKEVKAFITAVEAENPMFDGDYPEQCDVVTR